jgi:hypothetical protein
VQYIGRLTTAISRLTTPTNSRPTEINTFY